jgi:hypothetical protein
MKIWGVMATYRQEVVLSRYTIAYKQSKFIFLGYNNSKLCINFVIIVV